MVTDNYVSVGVFPPIEQVEKNKERIYFGKYPAASSSSSISVNSGSDKVDNGNKEDDNLINNTNIDTKIPISDDDMKSGMEADDDVNLSNDEIIDSIRRSKSFGSRGIKKKNSLGEFVIFYCKYFDISNYPSSSVIFLENPSLKGNYICIYV
jgi:hypothetical protein